MLEGGGGIPSEGVSAIRQRWQILTLLLYDGERLRMDRLLACLQVAVGERGFVSSGPILEGVGVGGGLVLPLQQRAGL